jgi:hypothetical protein
MGRRLVVPIVSSMPVGALVAEPEAAQEPEEGRQGARGRRTDGGRRGSSDREPPLAGRERRGEAEDEEEDEDAGAAVTHRLSFQTLGGGGARRAQAHDLGAQRHDPRANEKLL